jgi:L-threonylcarbamoyladenylate synthase
VKNIRLKRFIANGGVVAYPTESCFGLGCNPQNFRGIKKLNLLKKRPTNKNFILIAAELKQIKNIIQKLNKKQIENLYTKWPGPHTWLIKANRTCPSWLKKNNKVAIRIPNLNICQDFLSSVDMAVTSTSANKTKQHPIKNYREACRYYKHSVRIIKGRIGRNKKPSQIQDFDTKVIIRK